MPQKGEGTYDVVVIGAGTAGLVTAAGTAGLGGRVALIERAKMGGDCLNTGCVPSKALLSSARLVDRIRHAEDWGLSRQEPRFELGNVLERMRSRRAKIAPHDSQERFESLGVDVFRGSARFLSPHEVDVEGRRLRAHNIVIAAGSRPAIPAIDGLADTPFYTNETIFDQLAGKPERLTVLGGGPIGCELGQAFASLGVAVTILQRGSRILEKEDPDATDLLHRHLETRGVRILTEADVQLVTSQGSRFRVWVQARGREREPVDGDAILVAAGRTPNIEGLGLEAAGVAYSTKGIIVDERMRTSQPHIYAAGDIAGSYQFTHLADLHARTVVRNILVPWLAVRVDLAVLPWCTFTSPEVARVGVNEEQARSRGIAYDLYKEPMEELDRAVVEGVETGFAKVLVARRSDRILGATIVSERAGDLIAEFALAMKAGVGLKTISGTVHAYPTFAEIARKLADRQQKSRLTPLARRVAGWLYRARRSAR